MNKQASDCATREEREAEIRDRLQFCIEDMQEDGFDTPCTSASGNDSDELVEALCNYARGVAETQAYKRGARFGEAMALNYPEAVRRRHASVAA